MATIFNPFKPGGNKRAYILKQTCSLNLQVCLSVYDILVPPGVKMGQKGANIQIHLLFFFQTYF